METLNTRGLSIIEDSFSMRWKATGYIKRLGWLQAWGSTLIEAMEALQAHAAEIMSKKSIEEGSVQFSQSIALGEAEHTILMQAYSFPSAPIAKALLDTHTRGIQVQVILDKSQRTQKYSSADFLANQGVPIMIDANHAISHNKVMVIDRETVITGSFSFTKAAQEKNSENLLIIQDNVLVAQYTQNWQVHRQHSQPYVGRGIRE